MLSKPQMQIYTDPARFRVVVAGRRFGKAEPHTNEILTTQGWKTFGSISVGDYVFDEQGKPTLVMAVHPQGKKKIMRVHFSDNTYRDVAEDHLWTTWTHRDRKQYLRYGTQEYPPKDWAAFEGNLLHNSGKVIGQYGPKTRTTKELLETLKIGKRGDNNHSIPMCNPLEFPKECLPIDPYLYGLWLGNGAKDKGILTCHVDDVDHYIQAIENAGFIVGQQNHKKDSLGFTLGIKGFTKTLQENSLVGKDVPENYLYSSVQQRKDLLAGFLDSDGHIASNTHIEFCSMNLNHANVVVWLARSLGQKPCLYTGEATIGGKSYGTKYRVCWRQNKKFNPFKLERKACAIQYEKYNPSCEHRMITSIELLEGRQECSCISVDSPNHLYLTGSELIPTHNSILALNEMLRAAQTGMQQNVWYVAPTYRQAKTILWPMLKEAVPKKNIWYKNETDLEIGIKGYKSVISLKGAENDQSLRGAALSFLVLDEVQGIPLQTFDEVLFPAMTDQQADGVFIGTPMGKGNNAMYQMYLRGKRLDNWKSWQYTTADGGNVPPEELAMARQQMSEKQFNQEFLASFESLQGRLYYNFDLERHVQDTVKDIGNRLLVGIDFNVNPMCAVLGQEVGDELHIFDEIKLEDSNTMEMCQAIKDRYPNRDVVVFPDASGKNRTTKSIYGQTDHSIIKSNFGFKLFVKQSNPKVSDRINDVNALLKNADGRARFFVHPRCDNLIQTLDGHTYKEGTNDPDKDSGLDHMGDAVGYLISYKYSVIKRGVSKLTLDWSY